MFKPTYLYIKTHNKTGLKYFGKTVNKDPYSYKGSGVRWKNHLKKHGDDISTEIIGYYVNKEECIKAAEIFSRENNIVESNVWANLKEETGIDGGNPGEFGVEKMKRTKNSPDWKNSVGVFAAQKQKETKSSEEWKLTKGKEQQKKRQETISDENWKNTIFVEAKRKEKETKSKIEWKSTKGKQRSENDRKTKLSPDWKNSVGVFAAQKQKETKSSEEWKNSIGKISRNKCSETQNSPEWKSNNWKKCEFCSRSFAPGMYRRWHGENCKAKAA